MRPRPLGSGRLLLVLWMTAATHACTPDAPAGPPLPRATDAWISLDVSQGAVAASRQMMLRAATGVGDARARVRAAAALVALGDSASITLARDVLSVPLADPRPSAAVLAAAGALAHARAMATDGESHLVTALELTLRALEADALLAPALFNRALIESDLGLCRSADAAWATFLATSPADAWAEEARRRRGELPCGPGDGPPAAPGNDALFQTLADSLLPSWLATPMGDGDEPSTRRDLSAAAARLAEEAGDSLFLVLFEELSRGGTAQLDGARAFLAGLRHFTAQRYFEARGDLQRADGALGSGASAFGPWIRFHLVAVDMQARGAARAHREFERLAEDPQVRRFPWLEGRIRWGSAVAAWRAGRPGESLRAYGAAREAFGRGGYVEAQAYIDAQLAETFALLGQPVQGLASLPTTMRTLRRPAPHFTYRNALWAGAQLSSQVGAPRSAGAYLTELRAVGRAARDVSVESGAVTTQADVLLRQERFAEAARAYGAAGALAERIELPLVRDQWMARSRLGRIEATLRAGLPHEGITVEDVDSLAALFADAGPPGKLLDALLARALLARASGDTVAATQSFLRADSVAASLAGDLTAWDAAGFWESVQRLYDAAIATYMDGGRPWTALAFLESARSLGAAAPWAAPDPFRLDGASWRRSGLTPPTVLSFATVGDRIAWWRMEEGARVSGWLDPGALGRVRAVFPGGLERPTLDRPALVELYRVLLRPTLPPGASAPLVLVLDGALQRVPFAALVDPATGEPLLRSRTVSFESTVRGALTIPKRARRAPGERRATLVGDPAFSSRAFPLSRLPGAADEARAVAGLYPGGSTLLLGGAATPTAVRGAVVSADVLHLATHALPPVFGSHGTLVLAPEADASGPASTGPEDLLVPGTAAPELVILSACSTLGSEPLRAGGLLGLARPFFDAGSAAVLGTLWPVDDRMVARLWVPFHRALLAGASASEALRAAQLSILDSDGPDACCDWAAVQLIGDLRPFTIP